MKKLTFLVRIRVAALSLMMVFGMIFSSAVSAADITWTGETITVWALATNWSTGAIPTATDNVLIPNGQNIYINLASSVASELQLVDMTGRIIK